MTVHQLDYQVGSRTGHHHPPEAGAPRQSPPGAARSWSGNPPRQTVAEPVGCQRPEPHHSEKSSTWHAIAERESANSQ